MTPDQPSLLLVDDDVTFCAVMARALEHRGFSVKVAHDVASAKRLAATEPPEYALVDLKMPGDSGLTLVRHLHALDPETRIVMLTGFAGIATAVEAIKLGATHYLAKPVDADEVAAAFKRSDGDARVSIMTNPLTVERLEWEHIQRIFAQQQGNVSATARVLNMHRRTLQRKLAKSPPKNQE